jgi:Flp pilus assembly protein TadG
MRTVVAERRQAEQPDAGRRAEQQGVRWRPAEQPGDERRPVRRGADRGSVLPFTAAIVAALVACAGLAVDGGRILAARREAAALAASAARRASQELAYPDLAGGRATIDPDRATAVAGAFLARAGATGVVAASPQQVSVTVTVTASTVVLGAFGIGSKSVTATRSAAPFGGGGP